MHNVALNSVISQNKTGFIFLECAYMEVIGFSDLGTQVGFIVHCVSEPDPLYTHHFGEVKDVQDNKFEKI